MLQINGNTSASHLSQVKEDGAMTLERLPPFAIERIFEQLDPRSFFSMAKVCKTWRAMVMNEATSKEIRAINRFVFGLIDQLEEDRFKGERGELKQLCLKRPPSVSNLDDLYEWISEKEEKILTILMGLEDEILDVLGAYFSKREFFCLAVLRKEFFLANVMISGPARDEKLEKVALCLADIKRFDEAHFVADQIGMRIKKDYCLYKIVNFAILKGDFKTSAAITTFITSQRPKDFAFLSLVKALTKGHCTYDKSERKKISYKIASRIHYHFTRKLAVHYIKYSDFR